jgi:hypothetical protein
MAAGIGTGPGVDAWLSSAIPGVDARLLQACRRHHAELGEELSTRALRGQLEAGRRLLATLEPQIGGEALRRRKRRILWSSVGVAVVLLPVLVYALLHTEIPGQGPWRAAYHADRKLESKPVVRREQSVDHDWGKKAPLEEIPPEKFSVRFDTCLHIDEASSAVFQLNANDGGRVFLDGETLIDAWDKDPKTRRRGVGTAKIDLEAGVHHLRVEYFQGLGSASLLLSASFDGEVPAALPSDRLSYPGDDFDEADPCAGQ